MEKLGAAGRLIIVCGLPGSGKTVHAKELQAAFGGVRFCPDEWMSALEIDVYDEKMRDRIEKLQWKLAQELLASGQVVIIEWGTWARSERDRLRAGARALGAAVELHFLDAALDVLFKRIRERNMESPPIERDDLLKWNELFQRPTPEEMALFDGPEKKRMAAVILLKSLLHNLGVLIVGFCFAFVGRAIDSLLGISRFNSRFASAVGLLFLAAGFLLRVWATSFFYQRRMKVISLVPQKELITSGPYRISRNPLYLGGNVFIFLGAALFLGSPAGIALTAASILVVDAMIRREERQLAKEFSEAWLQYTKSVRRWL